MLDTADKLSVRELIDDIVPKLKATEKLVNNTLQDMIAKAGSDDERNRHVQLQQEFELELMMIHMNLDHLLKHYAKEIEAVVASGGSGSDTLLELGQNERFAIDSAKKLYARVRAVQTGQG